MRAEKSSVPTLYKIRARAIVGIGTNRKHRATARRDKSGKQTGNGDCGTVAGHVRGVKRSSDTLTKRLAQNSFDTLERILGKLDVDLNDLAANQVHPEN